MTDGLPSAVEIRRAEFVMLQGAPFTLWRILRKPFEYHFDAADRDEARNLKRQIAAACEWFWKTRDVKELEQLAEHLKLLDRNLDKLSSGAWVDGRLILGRSL